MSPSKAVPTKIFLANPQIDQAVYQELFHLNATEAARIATLVPRQQLLLKQPHVAKVLNLHVDPKSAALFSVRATKLATRCVRHVEKGVPMVSRWSRVWLCLLVVGAGVPLAAQSDPTHAARGPDGRVSPARSGPAASEAPLHDADRPARR